MTITLLVMALLDIDHIIRCQCNVCEGEKKIQFINIKPILAWSKSSCKL